MACCCTSPKNGGLTIFQGKFIGYTSEYVEFFLPTEDGEYLELPLNVQPDGSFCDTLQFPENLYDAALFADRFMFRVSVEQGKTYNAEFDLREEGVETNFRFIGEGAAENEYMKHLWSLDEMEAVADAATFKEFQGRLQALHAPLREELKTIANKPFVKFHSEELDQREDKYSYYFPFFTAGKEDADFAAFVAGKKKLSDDAFRSVMEPVCTNVPYFVKGIDVTDALKAAASCTEKPELKEWAMAQMIASLVGAGNTNGLEEGYEYFSDTVQNEDYLDQVDEICKNALLLGPGADAPDIVPGHRRKGLSPGRFCREASVHRSLGFLVRPLL